MATLTPQFYELLETREMDLFYKGHDQQAEYWPQLFQSKTSTKAFEDAIRISALGTYAVKQEGTPIAFDDPIQGTRIRSVHTAYGLGWRASHEVMRDDQFGIMDQMSSDLGDSARDHKERIIWDLINDGYTGARFTGLENEILFSATHARLRGGTSSNILSPPVALNVTGLEAMMTARKTTLSDEGRFVDVAQGILLVPPALEHQAYVLLNTERRPGTGDWDVSTVQTSRSGLTALCSPYLTSTTNWSVHAPPGKNSLTWFDRDPLQFNQAPDADTMDRKHYGYYRGHAAFREWRGNWGSQA